MATRLLGAHDEQLSLVVIVVFSPLRYSMGPHRFRALGGNIKMKNKRDVVF